MVLLFFLQAAEVVPPVTEVLECSKFVLDSMAVCFLFRKRFSAQLSKQRSVYILELIRHVKSKIANARFYGEKSCLSPFEVEEAGKGGFFFRVHRKSPPPPPFTHRLPPS